MIYVRSGATSMYNRDDTKVRAATSQLAVMAGIHTKPHQISAGICPYDPCIQNATYIIIYYIHILYLYM